MATTDQGAAGDFPGFPNATLKFLRALKRSNTRDWFTANRPTYESAYKQPAADFCAAMTIKLLQLTGQEHNSKVFRINRDLRFSKDKTPYNTHLHIAFTPQTSKPSPPMWFFGLDPGSLTVGMGVSQFEKAQLAAYRERIAGDAGHQIQTLLRVAQEHGARVSEPELKRVPKPYEQDHVYADLLRRKSLAVWIDFNDPKEASQPDIVAACMERCERLEPIARWLQS
jgi:uncharacterized protein (TIGR02453 family)